MSNFLEQRRDWKKQMIMADFDEDRISKHEAEERLLAVDEQYDKAKRWRDNVA